MLQCYTHRCERIIKVNTNFDELQKNQTQNRYINYKVPIPILHAYIFHVKAKTFLVDSIFTLTFNIS